MAPGAIDQRGNQLLGMVLCSTLYSNCSSALRTGSNGCEDGIPSDRALCTSAALLGRDMVERLVNISNMGWSAYRDNRNWREK